MRTVELSHRQAEIVMDICDGLTHKEIGRKRGLSTQTIKNHTHMALHVIGHVPFAKHCYDLGSGDLVITPVATARRKGESE